MFVAVTTVTMVRGFRGRVVSKYGCVMCYLAISRPPKHGESGREKFFIFFVTFLC